MPTEPCGPAACEPTISATCVTDITISRRYGSAKKSRKYAVASPPRNVTARWPTLCIPTCCTTSRRWRAWARRYYDPAFVHTWRIQITPKLVRSLPGHSSPRTRLQSRSASLAIQAPKLRQIREHNLIGKLGLTLSPRTKFVGNFAHSARFHVGGD